MAGVDLVAELVGVTLGPKGRNVVLQNKYGPPKIVNDGETILKEIEPEDPLENVGVKLVRQAGAKTNDIAGDGSTTSIVLAQGLISEGVKVIAAGMNPIQISQGIEKTAKALVSELKQMSREVEDHELADVAAVSAGNDYAVGNMISDALRQVGMKGVVTIEKGNYAENALQIVDGMQFDRGYLSPYFVTDRRKMIVEFHNCQGTVIRDDMGLTLEKAGKEVLGTATKVVITKDSTLIVTDGNTQAAVKKRASQIQKLVEEHRIFSEMLSIYSASLPPTPPLYFVGKHAFITRALKLADFDPKEKFWTRFPTEGSKCTPPHQSVDFKWKDYCPMVFREMFAIDPADYMLAICGSDALRELSSPGKSGCLFYLTQDDLFMIKTVKKSEVKGISFLESFLGCKNGVKAITALCPPKPNELEIAITNKE
ncbi:unnamed protein product [Camellia sinensis]